MSDRRSCAVTWCTSPHLYDTEQVSHHTAVIADNDETARVSILASERLDGRPSVAAHVAVIGRGGLHVDLTPRDAASWAALLTATRGRPWLAAALGRAAEILAADADDEYDDVPHYVTENAPTSAEESDDAPRRFTWGLVVDVFDTLERNGYRKGDDAHTGRAIGMLARLVEVYEGSNREGGR